MSAPEFIDCLEESRGGHSRSRNDLASDTADAAASSWSDAFPTRGRSPKSN